MTFSDSDFAGMRWNINQVPLTENVMDRFTELLHIYKEAWEIFGNRPFERVLTDDQTMRFIVLVYHRHSPLAQRMGNIADRKKAALQLAGVDLITIDKITEKRRAVQNIIQTRNEFFNRLSLHFLQFENSMKWVALCRKMEILNEVYFQMQQELEGTDKKSSIELMKFRLEVNAKCAGLETEINTLSNELTQEDAELKNYLSSQILLEKRKRLLTPEDYASLSKEDRYAAFEAAGVLR